MSPTTLAATTSVTQAFIDLQDKLTRLLPVLDKSFGDTVKSLKDLTDGLGKVKDGADEVADSFGDLAKATSAVTKEYEKQAQAMQASHAAQLKATAHMQALQTAAAPAERGGLRGWFNSAIEKATSLVASAKSAISAVIRPAAAEAEAKPSFWTRTKEAVGNTGAKLATKLGPHIAAAKTAFGEADEKGAADVFSAPLDVFNSLKDMTGVSGPAKESLAALDTTVNALKVSFAEGISPALQVAADMMRNLVQLVQPLTGFLVQHAGIVRFLAITLIPLVGVLFTVAKAIELVAFVTEVWGAAQAAFNIIMLVNPFVLIVVGLAALVAGFIYAYKNFQGFHDWIHGMITSIGEFIGKVWDAIGAVGRLFGMGSNKPPEVNSAPLPQMDASGKSLNLMPKDSTSQSPTNLGFPNLNFGLSPVRGNSLVAPQASAIHLNIQSLGTTTFNVDSLDKKHAVAMREHVREALVAALQDAIAPSPALA